MGEAGDSCGFHVYEICVVGGGQAAFFGRVGNLGAGKKPVFAGARIAAKALTGANIDDTGDIVGGAWRDFVSKSSGPADGEDKIDRTTVLDGGKGARSGVLTGSGASGDPFFFPVFIFAAPGPEVNAVAGRCAASRARAA